MVTSTSRDTCVEPDDMARYDTDFLNKINASGISPHRLALKVGACIILIRNLSLTYGHCNGTRYIIEQLTDNLIKARKLDGGPNLVIIIPRIPMISNETSFPVPFKRTQFPVLGAYYITLNRAQGQTLKFAGVHLPQSKKNRESKMNPTMASAEPIASASETTSHHRATQPKRKNKLLSPIGTKYPFLRRKIS